MLSKLRSLFVFIDQNRPVLANALAPCESSSWCLARTSSSRSGSRTTHRRTGSPAYEETQAESVLAPSLRGRRSGRVDQTYPTGEVVVRKVIDVGEHLQHVRLPITSSETADRDPKSQ